MGKHSQWQTTIYMFNTCIHTNQLNQLVCFGVCTWHHVSLSHLYYHIISLPPKVVLECSQQVSLSFHRFLYYSESGGSPTVSRVSLTDFSSSQVLFSTDLNSPSGVAIDFVRGRLYWADEDRGRIEHSGLNGQGRTTFASHSSYEPFQLAIVGDKLVWTTQDSTSYHVADLLDSSSIVTLSLIEPFEADVHLFGLTVKNENLRPEPGMGL